MVAPDAPSPPQSRPPLPRAVAAPDPTPVQGSGSVHPSWWRKHQAEPKSWSLSFARSAHPCWNPTGFVYLLFCWPLLDQHQKRSSFPQPSCLLILSARHQQCKSPTLLFDICQGEDMPHNSQKQRLFQHCTIVRTDEAQFCPSEDGCCTHFSSLSAAVFERSFSACCRQWHHTPSWTTGGKILCCYKCKLQNRLVKIYLQQDLVAKTVILLPTVSSLPYNLVYFCVVMMFHFSSHQIIWDCKDNFSVCLPWMYGVASSLLYTSACNPEKSTSLLLLQWPGSLRSSYFIVVLMRRVE